MFEKHIVFVKDPAYQDTTAANTIYNYNVETRDVHYIWYIKVICNEISLLFCSYNMNNLIWFGLLHLQCITTLIKNKMWLEHPYF